MKFKLYHDPARKTLAIPRAALQLSKLAESEGLTIHTESGCILATRNELTASEAIGVIQLLSALSMELISQLAEASREAAEELDGDSLTYTHGLTIPLDLLGEAGIGEEDSLDIETENGRIIITVAEDGLKDPLNDMDIELLNMLAHAGVDMNGLRSLLLETEAEQDE